MKIDDNVSMETVDLLKMPMLYHLDVGNLERGDVDLYFIYLIRQALNRTP